MARHFQMHMGIGHSLGTPTHFILQGLRVNIWLQNIFQTHRSQSPKSLHWQFDVLKEIFCYRITIFFHQEAQTHCLPPSERMNELLIVAIWAPKWVFAFSKTSITQGFFVILPLSAHKKCAFPLSSAFLDFFLLAFFFNRVSLMNMRVLLAISVFMSCVCVCVSRGE